MRTVFLLILLCSTGIASGQQPFVRDWMLNESAIPVRVNQLTQDKDHYLWLATESGLYRFNGNNFSLLPDTLHQPVTAVWSNCGEMNAGYNNGITGHVSRDSIFLPEAAGVTSAITCGLSYAGLTMAGTGGEGLVIRGNGWTKIIDTRSGLSDDYVYCLAKDHDKILVGTDGGINVLTMQEGSLHIDILKRQDLPELGDDIIRVIRPVGQGVFIIGTQNGCVSLLSRQGAGPWKVQRLVTAKTQINDVLCSGKNEYIIATDEGLLQKRGDDFRLMLDGVHCNSLLTDQSGTIWVATNQGLTTVTVNYAVYYRIPEPYRLKNVTAVAAGIHNDIWYSQNNLLQRFDLKTNTIKTIFDAPATITAICTDSFGCMWMGTMGAGLWQRTPSGLIRNIISEKSLIGAHILSIANTRGVIWVSTLDGIYVMQTSEQGAALITRYGKHSGIGSDYVYSMYEDREGRMWLATDGAGICYFQDNAFHHFKNSNGKTAYCVTEDASGNIWAATLEDGLLKYDGKSWVTVGKKEGLQDKRVTALAANSSGQIVAVHALGMDVWMPQSNQFRHFNHRLAVDIDSVSTVLNCLGRSSSGSVYVPFEHGIIEFKNFPALADIRPKVCIAGIDLFFKKAPAGQTCFAAAENHLTFRYDGISLANPGRPKYRYRLDNYNDSWIYTNDESVTFPQLAPGKYLFHVEASLSEDFSKASDSQFRFSIDKPLWRKSWFLVIAGLLLLLAGYSLIRMRDQNLKRMASLRQERLIFEYEHLKSQVNPHFLFNSLNTLASLIEDNAGNAVDYTTRLSDLYRNMLAYRSRDTITLGEEWELLENYIYIQQTRFGNALQLDASIPSEVMRSKRIIPLALQMLVENAIKHNALSVTDPLVISITATEHSIVIRNPLRPKLSREKGAGLGISNIKSRYELLSRQEVICHKDQNEFIVTLPLL